MSITLVLLSMTLLLIVVLAVLLVLTASNRQSKLKQMKGKHDLVKIKSHITDSEDF